jgi:hypothetical protein
MKLLKWAYEKINKRPAPYYYDYSPLTVVKKPLRKWITNSVAYNCPLICAYLPLSALRIRHWEENIYWDALLFG